jgi:hypothetical protein
MRHLCVDEAEVIPLSPAIELLSEGAARAHSRGPVWPGDIGYTGRTVLLSAVCRRPLALHVGCSPWQQERGCERHQARAGHCGGRVRLQAACAVDQQRWLNSRRTVQMRVFSATTLHCTTRSRTASSNSATRQLWRWLGPSSSRGECWLSSGERR